MPAPLEQRVVKQLAQPPQAEPVAEETVALERKGKVWLWISIGVVLVAIVGFVATTMLGQSVVYYKTPTEVKALQARL